MEDERLHSIEAELDEGLEQFSTSAEQVVQQRNQILNSTIQSLIELHSDQIKNIGLISGVVAPLSLTLLQVEALDIFVPFLLLGFILLLTNIALSQLLLGRELSQRNKLTSRATVKFVLASMNEWSIKDKKRPSTERTHSMFDFTENVREFDKLLNISPHSTEPSKTHKRLERYHQCIVWIFSVGCGLIIVSIFANPFSTYIFDFLIRIQN